MVHGKARVCKAEIHVVLKLSEARRLVPKKAMDFATDALNTLFSNALLCGLSKIE